VQIFDPSVPTATIQAAVDSAFKSELLTATAQFGTQRFVFRATWRTGANGYAAYKVADTVTTHQGFGMGSYCFFNVDPSIQADHAFEVPVASGVEFHSLLTVPLGDGTIDNIINSTGGPAQGTSAVPVTLASFQ
jgi:hypothetical protein